MKKHIKWYANAIKIRIYSVHFEVDNKSQMWTRVQNGTLSIIFWTTDLLTGNARASDSVVTADIEVRLKMLLGLLLSITSSEYLGYENSRIP